MPLPLFERHLTGQRQRAGWADFEKRVGLTPSQFESRILLCNCRRPMV
jgi:hypothetical protein